MSVLDVFAARMAGSIADPLMLVLLLAPGLLARTWRTRLIAAGAWTLLATLVRLDGGLELDAAATTFAAAMLYQLGLWFVRELAAGLPRRPSKPSAVTHPDGVDAPDVR